MCVVKWRLAEHTLARAMFAHASRHERISKSLMFANSAPCVSLNVARVKKLQESNSGPRVLRLAADRRPAGACQRCGLKLTLAADITVAGGRLNHNRVRTAAWPAAVGGRTLDWTAAAVVRHLEVGSAAFDRLGANVEQARPEVDAHIENLNGGVLLASFAQGAARLGEALWWWWWGGGGVGGGGGERKIGGELAGRRMSSQRVKPLTKLARILPSTNHNTPRAR